MNAAQVNGRAQPLAGRRGADLPLEILASLFNGALGGFVEQLGELIVREADRIVEQIRGEFRRILGDIPCSLFQPFDLRFIDSRQFHNLSTPFGQRPFLDEIEDERGRDDQDEQAYKQPEHCSPPPAYQLSM